MKQVIIIGGTLNSTLSKWMRELGITEYVHYGVAIDDISPESLQEYANRLYNNVPISAMIISVGNMADKLLNLVYMIHATLPDTRTKDKKKIQEALLGCKNYLTLRRFYGTGPGPTVS